MRALSDFGFLRTAKMSLKLIPSFGKFGKLLMFSFTISRLDSIVTMTMTCNFWLKNKQILNCYNFFALILFLNEHKGTVYIISIVLALSVLNNAICNYVVLIRVAILKYEKIAKFASENSQNSQLIFKNSHKLATFYRDFLM